MAVVTRYFSTTGAGAADGTTWADRAALFSGGNWSSIIKNFNFAGSDSLLCLIGPGTYSGITDSLTAADFANAPSAGNNLVLHGCNSSGVILTPPNPLWSPDMGEWDASSLPLLSSTTNLSIINGANIQIRLLRFLGSGTTTVGIIGSNTPLIDWCFIENSTSATGAMCASSSNITNSVLKCTGTAYAMIVDSLVSGYNTLFVGNASASSGNRYGIGTNAAQPLIQRVTVINNPGGGYVSLSVSTSFYVRISHCVFANNAGSGIKLPSTALQTTPSSIVGSIITGNGLYGIDAQSAARVIASGNRLRDNTSGNFNGFGNHVSTEVNYTTDSSDADEYVDAANGDFRIKASATIAPMGFGISVAKPTILS